MLSKRKDYELTMLPYGTHFIAFNNNMVTSEMADETELVSI